MQYRRAMALAALKWLVNGRIAHWACGTLVGFWRVRNSELDEQPQQGVVDHC